MVSLTFLTPCSVQLTRTTYRGIPLLLSPTTETQRVSTFCTLTWCQRVRSHASSVMPPGQTRTAKLRGFGRRAPGKRDGRAGALTFEVFAAASAASETSSEEGSPLSGERRSRLTRACNRRRENRVSTPRYFCQMGEG